GSQLERAWRRLVAEQVKGAGCRSAAAIAVVRLRLLAMGDLHGVMRLANCGRHESARAMPEDRSGRSWNCAVRNPVQNEWKKRSKSLKYVTVCKREWNVVLLPRSLS